MLLVMDTDASRKFKGVRQRKWGKWSAEIRVPNSRKKIWVGSFENPEQAAKAYDAALFCLRGPTSQFNFTESAAHIPEFDKPPKSPRSIQDFSRNYALQNSSSSSSNVAAGQISSSFLQEEYFQCCSDGNTSSPESSSLMSLENLGMPELQEFSDFMSIPMLPHEHEEDNEYAHYLHDNLWNFGDSRN